MLPQRGAGNGLGHPIWEIEGYIWDRYTNLRHAVKKMVAMQQLPRFGPNQDK